MPTTNRRYEQTVREAIDHLKAGNPSLLVELFFNVDPGSRRWLWNRVNFDLALEVVELLIDNFASLTTYRELRYAYGRLLVAVISVLGEGQPKGARWDELLVRIPYYHLHLEPVLQLKAAGCFGEEKINLCLLPI